MSPRRRQLVLKALFEIRGVLVGISGEELLRASDDDLDNLLFTIKKALDRIAIEDRDQ